MTQFTAGTKAFYDAHTHILPCVVLEVIEEGNGRIVTSGKLKIQVTKTTGPWKKGEVLMVTGYHCYPKTHRLKREYQHTINPNYCWVKTPVVGDVSGGG